MERKDYLVYLKKDNSNITKMKLSTEFKHHKPYRCLELSEKGQVEMLVNGEIFSKYLFDKLFVYVLDKVKIDFEFLGLTVNDKPISKTAFNKLADVHTYGKGKNALRVVFFNGFNKDKLCYGFYPRFSGDNKTIVLQDAYTNFTKFLNGNSNGFDNDMIQFGNCGIPLSYSDLRSRYVDTSKEI